ncbi:MAG: ABC transporter permease subunit [Actinobacteria bacterium]|jgi:multiple sugar transport system permease protein|nr:ABC transporter permease subunit [Actinomycetota bacterium]MTA33419.1 ABC transporter permease subunit [Actinomycetota bacterium]
MLAPLIAVAAVAVGLPLFYTLYLSVTDFTLTQRGVAQFVGADNYLGSLANPSLWGAIGNTAVYVLIAVSLETALGLLIALALQRQRWARDITRAMLLAPMFITPIAVGLTFRFLLNDQLGAIPYLLDQVSVNYDFLGSGKALLTLAIIDVWQWTPFMVLLLLAGLESIPKQPQEAAKVDGASAFYIFRRITLPLLVPVLSVAIMLRSLDALKVFEYVYATTRGGPGTQTETIQYFTYQTGIQFFRLGEASSMAFILLAIVLPLIIILFRRLDRRAER